jgi:hypothetical protein
MKPTPDPVVVDCAHYLVDDLTPLERLHRDRAIKEEQLKDKYLDQCCEIAAEPWRLPEWITADLWRLRGW